MSILDFEDLYKRSQSPGSPWAGASEAEVARAAAFGGNQGAALWEEMQGSPVKKAAYWWADKVDDVAQFTGLADLGAAMGRGGAGLVGSENVGQWEEAGRNMAGDVLSMLPLAIPFVGPVAGPVSMAANTLGRTGDYTSAAISAFMPMAMSTVGRASGNALANVIGREVGSFGDTIATIAGSQLGTGVAGLGVDVVDTLRQGGGVDDILNKDFLGMSLLGNLPFAGLDLIGAPAVRKQRIADANAKAAAVDLEAKNRLLADVPSVEVTTQLPAVEDTSRRVTLEPRTFDQPFERPKIADIKLETLEERAAFSTLRKQGVDASAAKLFVNGLRGQAELPKISEGKGKELVQFVKNEWTARRDRPAVDPELTKKALTAGLDPESRKMVESQWQLREAAYDLETVRQSFPEVWRKQQVEYLTNVKKKYQSASPKDKAQLREQIDLLERDLGVPLEQTLEGRAELPPHQRAEKFGYAPGDEMILRELERKKVIAEEQTEQTLREVEAEESVPPVEAVEPEAPVATPEAQPVKVEKTPAPKKGKKVEEPKEVETKKPVDPFFEQVQTAIDAGIIPEGNRQVLVDLSARLRDKRNAPIADGVVNEVTKMLADDNIPVNLQSDPTTLAKEFKKIIDRVRKRNAYAVKTPAKTGIDVRTKKASEKQTQGLQLRIDAIKKGSDEQEKARLDAGMKTYLKWYEKYSADAKYDSRLDVELGRIFTKWLDSGDKPERLDIFMKGAYKYVNRLAGKKADRDKRVADVVLDPSEQDGWQANVGRFDTVDPAKIDRDYIDAINRGDNETAQKLFDAVAKKAGYVIEVWHGMPDNGFKENKFMPGSFARTLGGIKLAQKSKGWSFLSSDKNVAAGYGNPQKFLIRPGLVVDIDANGQSYFSKEVAKQVDIATDKDFDLIRINNVRDNAYNNKPGGVVSTSYAIAKSSSAKMADLITRDDNGNIIPLSQRFDIKSDDIRFQTGRLEGSFSFLDAPDVPTVLTNILRRHGLDYDTATRLVSPALKVARLINDFTPFKTGELLNRLATNDGRQLLGLANVRPTARGIYVKALEGPMSNKRRANILTFTTAHELFHLFDADGRAGKLPEQLQLLRDQFVTDLNDSGVSTRRALMRTFIDDYMPRSMRDDPEVVNNIMNEANIRDNDEFLANVHAMMAMKMMRGGFADSIRFLPDSLRSYISKAVSFGRDVLDSIRGLFAPAGTDMSNIRNLSESYRRLARQIVKHERDLERTQFVVSQLEPGGLLDAQIHQKSFGDGDFSPLIFGQPDQIKDSKLKRAAKGIGKIFAPVQTLGHFMRWSEPALKHITFERQRMQQIIHKSREFFMKNPDGTDNPTPQIADLMRSPSLSHAHQKVRIILGRNLGEANMKMILEDVGHVDHAELKKTFDSLDSVEKKVLQEFLQQTRDAHRYVVGEYVESAWRSKGHLVGALALRAGKSKSLEEATEFGQRFLGTLREVKEPEQLQVWAEQTLQGDPSMAPFVKVGVKLWEWSKAFEGYVGDPTRAEYISERRNKEWLVQFITDKDETGSIGFDTEAEALAFKKNPGKFLPEGVDYTVKKTMDPWNTRMKARDKIKQSEMDALIDNAANKRRELMEIMQSEMGVDGEAAKLMSRHLDDLVIDVHRASLADNPMELGVTRNNKPGRELLNYVDQQIGWITRIAVGNSRRETDSYMKMVEADPTFKTEDGVYMKNNLYEHIENMRTPDTEAGKMFSRANFLWRIGGNLSSHVVEALSWPLIAAPALMARGAGFSEAFKLGAMASRYAFRYVGKDLGGRGAQKYEKLMGNDPAFGKEVDALVKEAQDAGLLHMHQQYDTDFDEIYTNIESMRKIFAGQDDLQADTTQFKVFDQAYKLASKVYQPFTRANAHVNLIMFYANEKKQLAKQGYKGDELIKKARENAMFYSSQANSSQGKGGRPIGLGGGKGFTRTLGMSMMSLQSFVLGHMANQIGYVKNALDKTVDPSVRAANKRAAMTSLGLHFAAAGALGLPGVGIMTGLASSLFGIDFEKETREWMTNDGKDDPLMADLVWHGLPFAAGVVPDVGSKLQAGGVSGFNSFNGWTGESMLGAIGAFAGDVRRAAGATQEQGWTSGLAELLPSAVKNAMKVTSNGGQIVGRDGTPIYTPEGMESVALTLGFQVNQYVRQRRAAQAGELIRQGDARANQRIADELSDLIVKGADPRLVKAKVKEFTDDPEIQKTLLRNTVDRATSKVYGRDPLNKATRGTYERISAINRAYGVEPRPIDEYNRIGYKQKLSNSLGLQTNPRQVGEAMLIDQIRQANPFMTTFEARQILKGLQSGRPQS